MPGSAHEDPAFRNAAVYTVAITYTIAGGSRPDTAGRRARLVAERLTNHAARAADVVEVTAVAGPSRQGEIRRAERVRFAAANSGRGTYAQPDKLDRYLDPDHERARASLAAADAAARARQRADRSRRLEVGCRNAHASLLSPPGYCACVYCRPELREDIADPVGSTTGEGAGSTVCLCGETVPSPPGRCTVHATTRLVVLDGDPAALHRLTQPLDRGPDLGIDR